jgi:hypothetical protein
MGKVDRGSGKAKKEQREWKRTRADREWSTVYWVLGGFGIIVTLLSGFSAIAGGGAADIVQLSVGDTDMLKRVFYGGDPWLVVCSEESASSISKFVALNEAANQIAEDGMKTAVLDCKDTFPKKGDTALKRFKLNQKKSGKFPITFFVSNGNKPKQLGKYVLTKTKKIVDFCNKYGSLAQLKKEKSFRFKGLTASDPQNLLFERCFKKKNKGCTVIARHGPLSVREVTTAQESIQLADRKNNFILVDKRKYQFDQFELFAPNNDTQLFHFKQLPKQKRSEGGKLVKYKGTEYRVGGRMHKHPLSELDAKAFCAGNADETQFKQLSALPELSMRGGKKAKKGKKIHLSSDDKKGGTKSKAGDKDTKQRQAERERRAREKMDAEAQAQIPEAVEDEDEDEDEDEEQQEEEHQEEDGSENDGDESDEEEQEGEEGEDEIMDEIMDLDGEEEVMDLDAE